MTNIDALVATNLWWTERKEKGAHHYILRIYTAAIPNVRCIVYRNSQVAIELQFFRH